ncbi:hypothetical protein B0J18DRAFT_374845 [Chaetomium sp. MPI-SDFR-AT-0129]|nr:hypothetical protein B0J18DRAFT_374845 [Chaetomium sp. MPI-SDFR-AT-0129]
MSKLTLLTTALALTRHVHAQCGAGTPDITVTGSSSSFTTTSSSGTQLYTGSSYLEALNQALSAATSGQRLAVMASGSIGASTLTLPSGITFEGCGTIDVANRAGYGAIEATDTEDVNIPYLTMTGDPYFGLRFSGNRNLALGEITMNLSGGLGIRFDRDRAASSNVSMDTITVSGAGSHAVETWNIDGLTVNSVVARDVGECGLLLQATTNAKVGLVDGDNVAAGTGYATFRMANNNGQTADGGYSTNVYVDKVVSRGGGRGIFCVSQSGAVEIGEIDLADNGNNSILIENCYNVVIKGGKVNGGGEVRISARDEFPNTSDVSITLQVDGTTVKESPCGDNISWTLTGSAEQSIC